MQTIAKAPFYKSTLWFTEVEAKPKSEINVLSAFSLELGWWDGTCWALRQWTVFSLLNVVLIFLYFY